MLMRYRFAVASLLAAVIGIPSAYTGKGRSVHVESAYSEHKYHAFCLMHRCSQRILCMPVAVLLLVSYLLAKTLDKLSLSSVLVVVHVYV